MEEEPGLNPVGFCMCHRPGSSLAEAELIRPRSKVPFPAGQVSLSGFHGHSLFSHSQ